MIAVILGVGLLAVADEHLAGDPDHPDEWDPRVAELADFVEEARGLEFDHPVYVDFLSPAEYTEASTADEAELEEVDRTELDQLAGQLRALGVASGELDLFAAFNQVSDSGTFAFYSEGRIQVRGTEVTIGLQATLVHELTHALQDQHFDLDSLVIEVEDSSQSVAARALAEGDAMRIEQAWVAELSDEDLETYDTEYADAVEESEAGTPDVPGFLAASFATPYYLGQPFVALLDNDGGNDRVDDAFGEPPSTEEHLFDPLSYIEGEGADTPDLGLDPEIETVEEDTFGSPALFLVLAERMAPLQAFEAALGWNGDRYAVYEEDTRTCVRAVFRGDTDADEGELRSALQAWAAAMPGGQAEALEVDGHPGLDACDPGPDVDVRGADRAADALAVPALFGFVQAGAYSALGAPEESRCVALTVIRETPYETLIDPEGEYFSTSEFEERLFEVYDECGSGDR